MVAEIFAIGTAVPSFALDQMELATNLAKNLQLDQKWKERLIKIFSNSKIKKRYSVIPDYQDSSLRGELYSQSFPEKIPGTYERNKIYKEAAPKLALEASKKALSEWGNDPSNITHVISVSCTGMMAPGIEFLLMDQLGLSRTCTKLGINFMGCFGAFRGLATARAFALENSKNRILVVCTELCSLHMQAERDIGTFVSNALFSDGAAAVIVGAQPDSSEKTLWEIHKHSSYAIEESLDEMTWEVGNHGFIMNLSQKVPQWVKKNINEFSQLLIGKDLAFSDCLWAVHPGGKAILESVAEACSLNPDGDLRDSWQVLKNFGNMSSATFLFVLENMLKQSNTKEWSIGLGFGPGLTLEGVLLRNVF